MWSPSKKLVGRTTDVLPSVLYCTHMKDKKPTKTKMTASKVKEALQNWDTPDNKNKTLGEMLEDNGIEHEGMTFAEFLESLEDDSKKVNR